MEEEKREQEMPEKTEVSTPAEPVKQEAKPAAVAEKKENIPYGIVGALAGAFVGGMMIVMLGNMGFVSSVFGMILAFSVLMGYEWQAGKMSKVGMAVSGVLIAAAPFCAYLVNTGRNIMNGLKDIAPELTLGESIKLMFRMMEVDPSLVGTMLTELLWLYLFTALGVGAYILSKKIRK